MKVFQVLYFKVSVVRIQVSGSNVGNGIHCHFKISGEFHDQFGDG